MTTFEDLFNKSVLSVLAPEASIGFPRQDEPSSWPAWLEQLEAEPTDRKLAFFDESLDFILTLRFEQSALNGDVDPLKPPANLLSYLAHLQVSYDASYISSITQPSSGYAVDGARPPVPPRSHSMQSTNLRVSANKQSPLAPPHPSIFPPHTPHPIPSTAESDKQYVQSQGTPLRSGIWGEAPSIAGQVPSETFALLWSANSYSWVAVFRMSVQVAFLPTKLSDPLLCLTVSTTLREKPVPVTAAREPLKALIQAAGEPSTPIDPSTPINQNPDDDDAVDIAGLEEVNLLEGLTLNATFGDSDTPLNVPSTRLGTTTRHQVYVLPPKESLPSSTPQALTPSTSRQSGVTHATLRKSFRKTLRTVSGFRVRMRTVFVPYFMLPQATKKALKRRVPIRDDSDESDEETDPEILRERELLEAGTEEHTVVLCVEVENGGESESGFSVENVKITVSGDGAVAHLIGWGDTGFYKPDEVFPLFLGPHEQYNLLYAVAFMRSPEADEFSLARSRGPQGAPASQELQRAVTIIISGRPYELELVTPGEDAHDPSKLSYPTHAFPSRWNCILDLSPQAPGRPASGLQDQRSTLPEPASPFPMTSTPTRARPTSTPVPQSNVIKSNKLGVTSPTVAGNKRHTFSAMDADASGDSPKYRGMLSPVNYRSGTSMLNPANQRDPSSQTGSTPSRTATPTGPSNPISNRVSYLPPSVTAKAYSARAPTTTYGPLSPPLPSIPGLQRSASYGHVQDDSIGGQISIDGIPPTPAYPAFPMSPPPTSSHWQGPLASQQSGPVGPSVEIRREKGLSVPGIPPTPGPWVTAAGAFTQSDSLRDVVNSDGKGEPIIVSVGLLRQEDNDGLSGLPGKIHPLDKFTLDIFVFNRSSWTRRFEVSYPDRREQRKEQKLLGGLHHHDVMTKPGIIPTENRVRIGPLLPSTCQSVRMDFLALTPGVHSIESLTLTDIQTGYTMHLRSVMDIVVHEHEPPHDA